MLLPSIVVALGVSLGTGTAQTVAPYARLSASAGSSCPPLPAPPTSNARPLFDGLELVAWWTPGTGSSQIVPLPDVPSDLVPRSADMPADATVIDPFRSLLVIDAATLGRQPNGRCEAAGPGSRLDKWTMGCLLVRIAGPAGDPERLARTWMDRWQTRGIVNGWPLPGDDSIDGLVHRWDRLKDGRLRPEDAPFRLIAIVNRIDRYDPDTAGHAGDARFVFVATDAQNQPLSDFTVIVEFDVRRGNLDGVRAWGRRWKALDVFALGSDAYRGALAALTDQFTRSSSVRIRTNKVMGGVRDWDMREFSPYGGEIHRRPMADTPRGEYNGPPLITRLGDWINTHRDGVLGLKPNMDPLLGGVPFLGGAAAIQYRLSWQPPVEPRLRHRFALATCNGCHYAETVPGGSVSTQVVRPQHIRARAGQPAEPSCFLQGGTVVAPDGSPRYFADLLRRATVLAELAVSPPTPVPGLLRKTRPRLAH
jgi:hypothetical protein